MRLSFALLLLATLPLSAATADTNIEVSLQSLSIAEGSGTSVVEVPMALSAPAAAPYTVHYEVRSWSAAGSLDFLEASGSITFAPGETAKHVPVTILGDDRWEEDELLFVTLSDPWWIDATVTILNDDPIPVVAAEHLRIPEGNAASTAFVKIRAPYPVSGWVLVRLADGSARATSDFEGGAEYLYFDNESAKTFPFTILGDEEPEPSEWFAVEVRSASFGLVGGPNGVVTLVNDDVSAGPAETPRLMNVSPASGTSAGGTHVRVEGTAFDGSCWLFFGELAAAHVVVRDAQSITAAAPPHAAGAADVTVRCSGGTSTLPQAFTYRDEDDPAPLILEIAPPAAAPGELVTIRGLNFRPTDGIAVGAASATIVDSAPEQHVISVPELPAGSASIFVRDVSGRTTTSGPLFSVLEARPPRIAAVAPANVAAGGELELTGEGFRPGYTFEIGGRPAAIVSSEYTRVVVRVAAEVVAGSHAVQVRNSAGVLAAIGPDVEIVEGGTILTSADPRCTTTDGGGYATIHGRGFAGSAAVSFAGVPSADVVVIDGTTLRVAVPLGAPGLARIAVTDDAGRTATLTNGFRYVSPFDPQGCGPRARSIRE
jgi:Calx-beta domain/IPT/TIG domain